ncbi:MAG TPA: hypothetical protein VFE10_06485 [Phenylobacterium sp.]|jgi:hypothetical protein|nr:hypothetical protein [Phenylobacterium sp.]
MAAILLGAGASQADRPDASFTDGEGQAIDSAMQQAESVEPILAIGTALIANDCMDFEVRGCRQRYAVLGDVGGVLGPIELDLQGFIVATKKESSRVP